jgi:amino acid permease
MEPDNKEHLAEAIVIGRGGEGSSAFGAKTISYAGSCCLNLNNVMGAAIVALPLVNQQAGWLTPTLCILFVFVVSSFASTMLVEAMQRIPGNRKLTQRWEFCAVVGHYFGPRVQMVTSWVYNASLQSTNIAAMIVSAQVMDVFIIYTAGHSVALDYHNWPLRFIKSEHSMTDPWLTQWVISAGFVLSMVVSIPLGYINLEDNMKLQFASLLGLLVFTGEFFVQFVLCIVPGTSWNNADPTWGPRDMPVFKGSGQYQVLGLAIFAYAYVTTIPSWANEKQPGVDVNRAVWWPAVWGTALKLGGGILGSFAFRLVREDGTAAEGMDNILNRLVETHDMPLITVYSAYFWNISTLIPGIPVLAIMVRYNLLNSKACGPKMAFFLGVVAPWLVTMFCYQASMLTTICNWTAVLFISGVNLVVPVAVYRQALLRYGGAGSGAGGAGAKGLSTQAEAEPLLGAGRSGAEPGGLGAEGAQGAVQAVPDWLADRVPGGRVGFAEIICATVTLLSVAVIVLNVYTEVAGATVKSDGSPSNHSGGSHSRLASEADVFSSRSEY